MCHSIVSNYGHRDVLFCCTKVKFFVLGEKTKVDKSAHEDKDAKKPDKDSANL